MKLACENCGEAFHARAEAEFCPDCIAGGEVVECTECSCLFPPAADETLCADCSPDDGDDGDDDRDRLPSPAPENTAQEVAGDLFRYEKLDPAAITPEFAAAVAEQLTSDQTNLRVRDYSQPRRPMVDLDPARWRAAFAAELLRLAAGSGANSP